MKNIEIIAHRGGDSPHDENTLEAFNYAIDKGSKAIEMDIRYDYFRRRFYLVHDFLHRPKWKRNLLLDVIDELPKDLYLVIELKTISVFTCIFPKKFKIFYDEYLKDRNIIAISFNPFVLMRLKKIAPYIPRGILCGSRFWNYIYCNILRDYVDAEIYIPSKRFLNRKVVLFAKKHGVKLYTYLINTKKSLEKIIKYNIDGFITDNPPGFVDMVRDLTKQNK